MKLWTLKKGRFCLPKQVKRQVGLDPCPRRQWRLQSIETDRSLVGIVYGFHWFIPMIILQLLIKEKMSISSVYLVVYKVSLAIDQVGPTKIKNCTNEIILTV